MLTDDDLKAMRQMIEEALDARGLERLPTGAALRMKRYRERLRNASVTDRNESVTHSPAKRNSTVTKRNGGVTVEAPTNAVWRAYAAAYEKRWTVPPQRNRTVNGQLAQFITRIPAAEAPEVAAFYVQSNRHFYVLHKHPVSVLLKNAESLRTEWATGQSGTETEARQIDRTQGNLNSFAPLLAEARAREANGSK